MAANFVQPGDVITVTAPSGGVSSGDGVLSTGIFGVALTDAAEAASVEVVTRGVFTLPKATSANFSAIGSLVSWDATEGECVAPGSGKYPIGVATAIRGTSTTTVPVRLNGTSTAAAS